MPVSTLPSLRAVGLVQSRSSANHLSISLQVDQSEMNRVPFTVISAIMAALSLATVVLMLIPVEFRRARSQKEDSWSVWITMNNMLCRAPQPNVNVSLKQVHQYWGVAESARMSERMAEIGECVIGVKTQNQLYPTHNVDVAVCYCLDNYWAPMMVLTSLIAFAYWLLDFGLAVFVKSRAYSVYRGEYRRRSRWAIAHNIMFDLTMIIYALQRHRSTGELSYTEYGSVFSADFYAGQPFSWKVAFWLYLTASYVNSFYFVVFFIAGILAARKQTAAFKKKLIEKRKSLIQSKIDVDAKNVEPSRPQWRNVPISVDDDPNDLNDFHVSVLGDDRKSISSDDRKCQMWDEMEIDLQSILIDDLAETQKKSMPMQEKSPNPDQSDEIKEVDDS